MSYKILILPGDGIGPEVMKEVDRVINWFNKEVKFISRNRIRKCWWNIL